MTDRWTLYKETLADPQCPDEGEPEHWSVTRGVQHVLISTDLHLMMCLQL